MTTSVKMNRHLIALLVLPVLLSVLLLFSCNKDKEDNSPAKQIAESEKLTIPAAIELPANPSGNSRLLTYYAEGVQKYKAQAKAGSPGTFEWVFVAPQADLFNASNSKIGTHSAGPTWQLFGGADSIYAQHFTPARTAPSSDPASIDWLLLMPKTGKPKTGVFAHVDYIQRIATKGGKAPSVLPLHENETAEVKYTAIYRFAKKNL